MNTKETMEALLAEEALATIPKATLRGSEPKVMTVADLIKYLQQQPQDLPVAYELHSEFCLLEERDIEIVKACSPRPDGWVARERPDKKNQLYLMLPGN